MAYLLGLYPAQLSELYPRASVTCCIFIFNKQKPVPWLLLHSRCQYVNTSETISPAHTDDLDMNHMVTKMRQSIAVSSIIIIVVSAIRKFH